MGILYVFGFMNAFMMATGTTPVESEAAAESELQTRIAGGIDAPFGEFNFMVALHLQIDSEKLFQCSATLISDRLVLTAAHCITLDGYDYSRQPERFFGYFGHVRSTPQWVLEFEGIYVHEGYKFKEVLPTSSDVALLVTKHKVGVVKHLCLSSRGRPELQSQGLAVGWGSITQEKIVPADTLQVTNVSIGECPFEYVVGDSRLCTKVVYGKICKGDSGGPLVLRDKRGDPIQVGITSIIKGPDYKDGDICGGVALYEIVSNYLPFIRKTAASYNSQICEK